jgi:choline dehydrogenase
MVNDSSYTFENVLPFYEKSTKFTPPNTNVRLANATTEYDASVFTASGVPLQVAYTNYVSSLSTLFKSAIEKLGITSIKGFNSGSLLGSSYCTSTLSPSDQTRSTSTAYMDSALDLPNLKVYTQTLA